MVKGDKESKVGIGKAILQNVMGYVIGIIQAE